VRSLENRKLYFRMIGKIQRVLNLKLGGLDIKSSLFGRWKDFCRESFLYFGRRDYEMCFDFSL
jgi:hypothetical protein